MKLYYELSELEEAKADAKEYSAKYKRVVHVDDGVYNEKECYLITEWVTGNPVATFYCGNEVGA